jgi:hypothetical protein
MPLLFVNDVVPECYLQANDWGALSRQSLYLSSLPLEFILSTETMAEHRAKSLSTLLPVALATGFSETEFEIEPLKVLWLSIRSMKYASDQVLRTLTLTS